MGQQQLLLIILGVIIVGIAIAVGISMFGSGAVQSNKDGIVNELNNLAANAYQHRTRPATMGGGYGAYDNSKGGTTYSVPTKLDTTENGYYSASVTGPDAITFTAISAQGYGNVTADLGADGKLTNFGYTGDFQ